MTKLLNRFAWFISIIIAISISAIDFDFIIIGIIAGFLTKFLFLSESFISDRLIFFVNGINKGNYSVKNELSEDKNIKEASSSVSFSNKGIIEEKYLEEDKINNDEIKEEKLYIKPEKIESSEFDILLNKLGKYISDFFSTNIIAKIGSLILFFVVIYFLKGYASDFWDFIGPLGRLISGFVVSIIILGFGVKLEKTDAKQEGLILIGLSILLNFAIILSGRYLIGDNGIDGFLTSGVTFILLILNVIFGIITSFVYKSRNLLIFSFIFAYLNPFLIGDKGDGTPYILIGYSFILSLGALFISKKENNFILFVISFIFGNLLFLVAPFDDSFGAISKLIVLNIFNISVIYIIFNFTKKYNNILYYLFLIIFGINLFFYTGIENYLQKNYYTYLISIISSILFLFIGYYLSFKKALLFPITTFGSIISLGFIIFTNNGDDFIILSIISLIIFAITNWIVPFINKKLFKKQNFNSLLIGSILGVVFIGFKIYDFGESYFKGFAQGLAFLSLAIIYFIQGYFIIQKIGFENMKEDEDSKNIFYSFAGISISLFSIAVAFIFSDYPQIISTTWLFEATILYYFYSKNSSIKVFISATILFLIGLTKFGILLDVVRSGDYKFLISFVIIFISFILNLFFINKVEKNNKIGENIHHILHLLGMGIMGALLFKIIPSTGHGWSMIGVSIFITILGSFYAKLRFGFLKISFIFILILVSIFHFININYIFWKLETDNLSYLKILQYIVSFIILFSLIIWEKINETKKYNKIINIVLLIYIFLTSNLYIFDIFGNLLGHFSLTIYWGFISSALLFIGISKDVIKYRTIGLYFLGLTTLKIFIYDIWFGVDGDSRFVALGVLGVIFIIISSLYSKRYGNNILLELDLSNLKSKDNFKIKNNLKNRVNSGIDSKEKIKSNTKNSEENFGTTSKFNNKLDKINIDDIKVVRFYPNNLTNFTIRSKNLTKIVLLIKSKTNKTTFKSGELNSIYKYIIENYKTNLSRREHDKIKGLVKDFVEQGGKFEIVKK